MKNIGKESLYFCFNIVFLILLASFKNQVAAQIGQEVVWYDRLFDNTDGLSGGHVYQVFEDKSGFLWLVTQVNLQFFDGNYFYIVDDYYSARELDKVRILCQDTAGKVWVRYEENGRLNIRVFDGQSRALLSATDFLPEELLEVEIIDATTLFNGDFLLLTLSGDLWLQSGDTGLWTRVATCIGLNFEFVASSHQDGLWLVSKHLPEDPYRTLGYWNGRDKTLRYFYVPDLIHVQKYKGEDLILMTKTQLGFMGVNGKIEWHAINDYFPDFELIKNSVRLFNSKFGYDPTGGVAFLIYENYLHLSNLSTQKPYYTGKKFFLNSFFSASSSREQNIWFGTLDGLHQFAYGVNPFQRIMWLDPSENQFIYQNAVRGIAASSNGKLFFTANENLYEYDPEVGQVRKLITTYNGTSDVIWDEHNERIWTLGSHFIEYDPLGDEFTLHDRPVDLSQGTTFGLHSMQDSLLLSSTTGIWIFRTKEGKFVRFKAYGDFQDLVSAEIYGFIDDSEKELFIYTNKGIFVWEKGGQVTGWYSAWSKGKYYIPTFNVRHIHRDSAGVYWLATAEGLIRWEREKERIQPFTIAGGLYDQNLYGVFEDNHGFLWLSTNNGIIQFHKDSGFAKHYSEVDGITNNEFNRISHEQDKAGNIYFGSLNGITKLEPDMFVFDPLSLDTRQLHVTHLSVFSKEKQGYVSKMEDYYKKNIVRIYPTELNLEAIFAIADFDVVGEGSFAYRLSRTNSDIWVPLQSSILQIPSLPYGKYNLEIRVRDKELKFGDSFLVIPIEVIAPMYRRKWFIVLMILVFCILSAVVVVREIDRRDKQNQLLQKMVAESIETIAADKKLIEAQAASLELKNLEKDRFFANISHEFRTPISLILGTAGFLEEKFKSSSKEFRMLQTLKNNAQGLLKLINDILMLSKLDYSPMVPKEEIVDLEEIIAEISDEFDGLFDRKNITFTKKCMENDQVWIKSDKQFLKIILQNLLSNALKFTPVHREVSLEFFLEGNRVIIHVQDTGRGIHPDDLPHIFERYYQSTWKNARVEGGTGIGLSLVRELVTALGGRVEVTSVLGEGTTFKVELPLVGGTKPVSTAIAASDVLGHDKDLYQFIPKDVISLIDGRHLLVVEDNADFYDYIKQILGDVFDVKHARSGKEALVHLRGGLEPVLIITDIMMQEMDGLQLITYLKASSKFKDIPVIALTARADDQCRIDAFSLGVNDYLLKPFDAHQLMTIIAYLLERRFASSAFKRTEYQTDSSEPTTTEWLLELKTKIEKGIESADFTVEQLAIQMSMSRSTFFTKVKSVAGLTPNQLIMEIRLQKARACLIENPKLTNKQVMKMVGLKHEPHFIAVFTRRFGYRPGQMKNE